MAFIGIETVQSPAKRRDGSGDTLPGHFTKKRVIVCTCDQCGVRLTKKYKRGSLKQYQEQPAYCSRGCADLAIKAGGATRERMSATCVDKYGVDNPAKLPETWDKIRATSIERYGAACYLGSEEGAATKQAFLSAQGVQGTLSIPSARVKYQNTLMLHYGVPFPAQSPVILFRRVQTSITRFGFPSRSQHPEARQKFSLLARTPAFQAKRHATLMRNGVFKRQASKGEDAVFGALVQVFPRVQRHVRVHRWNIDFFIPELASYVNYNGVYWHGRYLSDADLQASLTRQSKVILGTKQRDRDREVWFREQGLRFEVIWEDEREEAVSRLLKQRTEVDDG